MPKNCRAGAPPALFEPWRKANGADFKGWAGGAPALQYSVIGAIVLAAGSSSRLGQAKQLLPFRGQSLVRRAACAAIKAGCQPIVIVVGWDREQITTELSDLPVAILPNENWENGIGSSIRAAVASLQTCEALVILACDQPYVDASQVQRLIESHQQIGKPIVASAYSGTLGIPALFGRAFFSALSKLGDDSGAKIIIAQHPDEVAAVDFPKGAIDIDRLEDYQKLIATESAQASP